MFLIVMYVLACCLIMYTLGDEIRKHLSIYKSRMVRLVSFYILFVLSPIIFVAGCVAAVIELIKGEK